jgi:hypothetical protein
MHNLMGTVCKILQLHLVTFIALLVTHYNFYLTIIL